MQNPSYYPQHLTYPFSSVGLSSSFNHQDYPHTLLFKNCENSSESPNDSNSSSPIPKQSISNIGNPYNKKVLLCSTGPTSGGITQYKDPPQYNVSSSYCKDNKYIKTGDENNGHSGRNGRSSFSIDSLLGLSNIASAAINMQSGHHNVSFLPNQLCGMNLIAAMNCWSQYPLQPTNHPQRTLSKENETKKDIRFHPFNQSNQSSNVGKCNSDKGKSETRNSTTEKPEDVLQSSRRVGKAKRIRTIFTPEQLERLEKEFERQQYMVGPERLYLASALSLTEAQVKVWFQNRRIKWRKQHLELQQQRLAAIRSQQLDLDYESESEFGSSVPSPTPTIESQIAPDSSETNAILGSSPVGQTLIPIFQTEILKSEHQILNEEDQNNDRVKDFEERNGGSIPKLFHKIDCDYN